MLLPRYTCWLTQQQKATTIASAPQPINQMTTIFDDVAFPGMKPAAFGICDWSTSVVVGLLEGAVVGLLEGGGVVGLFEVGRLEVAVGLFEGEVVGLEGSRLGATLGRELGGDVDGTGGMEINE